MGDEVLPADMCPTTPGKMVVMEHSRKVQEGEDCDCSIPCKRGVAIVPELSTCCYIGEVGKPSDVCYLSAEWLIVFGPGPADYTEACTEHVGELLWDKRSHTVTPIEKPSELTLELKPPSLGTIHVIMTRGRDGGSEGNEWEFSGSDKSLYNLFEILGQVIIGFPFVVKPDKKTTTCRGCGNSIDLGKVLCESCAWVDEG